MQVAPLPDEPWADAWRAHFRPVPVGRRLLVCPPWEVPPPVLQQGRAGGRHRARARLRHRRPRVDAGAASSSSSGRSPAARVSPRPRRRVRIGHPRDRRRRSRRPAGGRDRPGPRRGRRDGGQRPAQRRGGPGARVGVGRRELGRPRGAARPRESPGGRPRHARARAGPALVAPGREPDRGRAAGPRGAGGRRASSRRRAAGSSSSPRTTVGPPSSCAEGDEGACRTSSPPGESACPGSFVRPEAVGADRVRFDAAEAHHLRRVLRLRTGRHRRGDGRDRPPLHDPARGPRGRGRLGGHRGARPSRPGSRRARSPSPRRS